MRKVISTVVLLLITVVVSAQETVKLRVKYQKGDEYQMTMTMEQNMGMISSNTLMIAKNTIVEVENDEFTTKTKFERIKMDMIQAGATMSYDSDTKEEELDEMGKMLKTQVGGLLKAEITSKTNARGKVLDVKITPPMPGAESMSSSGILYPEEALKVGDSWSEKKEQAGMVLNFVYKLTAIGSKEVTIEVSGDVSGMATGTISGNMSVNKTTGIPSQSSIEMKMDASGQKIDTKVSIEMKKI